MTSARDASRLCREFVCAFLLLPLGAAAGCGTSRGPHTPYATSQRPDAIASYQDWVTAATFSPDGKVLATVSQRGDLSFWDVASGIKLRDMHCGGCPRSVAYSPDGSRLLCDGYGLHIWDVSTGQQIAKLSPNDVKCATFSPDGKVVASAGDDGFIIFWDSATGQQMGKWQAHSGTIWGLQFSKSGSLLASCSDDKTVKLWDARTNEIRRTLGHPGPVYGIAFSADGRLLAAAGEDATRPIRSGEVRLWSTEKGEVHEVLSGYTFAVYRVAFSPDCKVLATGGKDFKVKLWNLADRTSEELPMYHAPVWAVTFSPDGESFVSAGGSEESRTGWIDLRGRSMPANNATRYGKVRRQTGWLRQNAPGESRKS